MSKNLFVYFTSLLLGITCITNYASAASWVDVPSTSIEVYDIRNANQYYSVQETYCSNLGGRIPTQSETTSLFINKDYLQGQGVEIINTYDFWTSTVSSGEENYTMHFSDGTFSTAFRTLEERNVLCVKDFVSAPLPYESTFDPLTVDVTSLVTNFVSDAFAPLLALGVILAVLFKTYKKTKKII